MPEYRRAFQPGGTFFFTVVSYRRRKFLTEPLARTSLHRAIDEVRQIHPFSLDAIVLLPDHLHCIWVLPEDDTNFSLRWQLIKSRFSRYYRQSGGKSLGVGDSRRQKQESGLWQRRFWEHTVRNEKEFAILCDYIHFNPVKHGYVVCPHQWEYSTFGRFVDMNRYEADWCCACKPTKKKVCVPSAPPDIVGE